MNRTERLFVLMDALRRHRRPVTAADLAAEAGVSVRTIYRDIDALVRLGAPIDGEAGLGYVLRAGFFLPPLAFDREELEALVLGARWVLRRTDEKLARAAKNALAKIAAATQEDRRDEIARSANWVAGGPELGDSAIMEMVREAIYAERKLGIDYVDADGEATSRTIWPIAIAYFDQRRLVVAWCELRQAFRQFRPDRIEDVAATRKRYPPPRRSDQGLDRRDRLHCAGVKTRVAC
jgi:predicted DNA-binding transcriptional regulator YafY